MRVVALISGGKDSCFNMMHVHAEGHTIVALANLYPDENGSDELDSYMYQTVGHEAIGLYSEAMDLPLFRRKITGHSKSLDLDYVPNEMDEVEDLYELLREISKSVKFDAVSSGAILSDYQRIRVESVCHRLGLKSLSYLWQRNQEELLQEMISCGLKAILIKTAALGLEPTKHLGKTLEEMCETLHSLNEKYGCHVCGEGGEFETFTLDCPLFKKEIIVDESQICIHSDDFSAPVGYLKLKKMHLKQKIEPSGIIEDLPLTTSTKWANKFLSGMKYKDAIEMNSTVTMPQSSNIIHSKETLVHSSYEGKFIRVSNLYGNTLEKQTPEMIENVTVEVLKKLEDILWQQGHALKDVCYIQIYVSNMSDYEFINKAYLQFFDRSPPARTCIGCINRGQFGMGKTILQISATSCKEYSSRRALHVQSISHWSPPNIGPFSQCVSVDKILFVSGTIGLVPGSMKLISGGAKSESILALAHVGRVMNVMPGTESTKIVQSICYVNSINDIQYGLAAWEDASSTCKPIYLVVKELPKCAKAEWQVIGYKTSDTIEKNLSDSAIVKQDGLKICQTSRLISTDNAKIYSYVASVAIPSNNDLCDVGHYLEGLYQDMSNWMEQRALQPADITQLFLFSCVEGASPISLNEMWNKSSGADIQAICANVDMIFHDGIFCALTVSCVIYSCISSEVV